MMTSHWPYYDVVDGKLFEDRMVDRQGKRIHVSHTVDGKPAPLFASAAEAEAWLEENDIRGSVRS